MDVPDIYTLIQALLSIFGSGLAVFFAFPAIKDFIGAANSDFIRIAAGAFTGSSSAGIVYLYLREKLHTFPLLFKHDHVIVCGLNFRSMLIVNDLVSKKIKPVIIESDARNTHIESCKVMGLIVLVGNPSDPNMLNRAGVKKAKHILSFDDQDENNAEVALRIIQIASDIKSPTLTCTIQVLNPQLYGIIRKQAFIARKSSSARIEFFNQYALGARTILDLYPPFPDKSDSIPIHPVMLIGAGRLGESILIRVARTWYTQHRNDHVRLPVIIADTNAERIREGLLIQYPKISAACDLIALSVDVQSATFKRGELLKNPLLMNDFITYICLDDDSIGLFAALTLHQFSSSRNSKFIVRMDHNTSVAKLIADDQAGIGNIQGIYPVNMFELTANSSLILAGEEEILARAIHENYCRNERLKGQTEATNNLIVSWDLLKTRTRKNSSIDGEKYRQSNRSQANFIWTKLALIGCDIGPISDWDAPFMFRFSPDEIEQLSRLEHERWMNEKQNDGWRYGTERNDAEKLHPSIVPYEQLPETEKEKDRDTIRQIPEILSLIDFQIYRREINRE
jgi:hypothetical protein